MFNRRQGRFASGAILSGALVLAVAPTQAAINLEFRKARQSVCPGQQVRVSLFAVSDSPGVQLLSAIDLVLAWDPAYLQLQGPGFDQTGSVDSSAHFFPASDPFHLNEVVPPQDGDGLFSIWAQLGTPIGATPAGVQVTTFVFTALASTPGPTLIEMRPSGGSPPVNTTVWSGVTPGTPVTGTLSNARVGITFQICPGDINDDLIVDLTDLALLLSVFGTTNPLGDLDCNGVVDINDLAVLLSRFGLPCG